jgi:hypothetical protein
MINLILNRKTPGKIDVLELDATLRETEDYQNEVTEFPVESGFTITDHVIHKPERLSIEGFVTNTPIPNSIVSAPLLITGQGNRVKYALETLLELAGFDSSGVNGTEAKAFIPTPHIISVEMGLRIYNDMIIESLSVPRDKDTGETLRFTIQLKRVIIVKTDFVKIENSSELNGKAKDAEKQATEKKNKGAQTAKKVDPVSNASLLSKIMDGIASIERSIGFLGM